jgi:hypothetical protein
MRCFPEQGGAENEWENLTLFHRRMQLPDPWSRQWNVFGKTVYRVHIQHVSAYAVKNG